MPVAPPKSFNCFSAPQCDEQMSVVRFDRFLSCCFENKDSNRYPQCSELNKADERKKRKPASGPEGRKVGLRLLFVLEDGHDS